jgi:hypothetical protein
VDLLVHERGGGEVLADALEQRPQVVQRRHVPGVRRQRPPVEHFGAVGVVMRGEAQQAVAAQHRNVLGIAVERPLEQLLRLRQILALLQSQDRA